MHKYIFVSVAFVWMGCVPLAEALTLHQAVQRTIDQSPGIKASLVEVEMKEADLIQAGLSPNPEFSAEYDSATKENKRSSACHGCEEAEFSYGLSQTIETGGKRQARMDLACYLQEMSCWDAALKEQELSRKVAEAFMLAVHAQEKMLLAKDHLNVASELRHAISCKVEAGKESQMQEKKAQLTQSSREIALKGTQKVFARSQQYLAALWGSDEIDFDRVEYPFYEINPPISWEDICEDLPNHPSVARWDAEIDVAYGAIELEKAKRVPDVTVSGGLTHEGEIENTSFYVGLSFPIPVCDRNQGNLLRAYRQLDLAEQRKEEALCNLKAEMRALYIDAESAYEQAVEFKDQVLVMAQQTFQTMKEGFNQGQVDCIEVFEAQKMLFEMQEEYVNLLHDYHTKKEILSYFLRRQL